MILILGVYGMVGFLTAHSKVFIYSTPDLCFQDSGLKGQSRLVPGKFQQRIICAWPQEEEEQKVGAGGLSWQPRAQPTQPEGCEVSGGKKRRVLAGISIPTTIWQYTEEFCVSLTQGKAI